MATPYNFPAVAPSYSSNNNVEFQVVEAPFGDGYTQRSEDGLNSIKDTWNLVFDRLDPTDLAAVYDFLRARRGVDAFNWTPPGELTSRQWRCKQLAKEPAGYNRWTVTAVFIEEFDP